VAMTPAGQDSARAMGAAETATVPLHPRGKASLFCALRDEFVQPRRQLIAGDGERSPATAGTSPSLNGAYNGGHLRTDNHRAAGAQDPQRSPGIGAEHAHLGWLVAQR
jgi:hypothetical protein